MLPSCFSPLLWKLFNHRFMKKRILFLAVFGLMSVLSVSELSAQSDVSLFWRKDSIQLTKIVSPEADQYKLIGHHGPAVENMYMALRIYFNNSGSIDVYSKQRPQLELATAHWYPTEKMQLEEGYGCDEYKVGSTVGLGGYNLWDGKQILKLEATEGRELAVKKTSRGAYAEMLAKGVAYNGQSVDILIRVTVRNHTRWAKVEAFSTGGKVCFVTGVNCHPESQKFVAPDRIAVWAKHPADVSQNPIPIGGGMVFDPSKVQMQKITSDAVLVISYPMRHFKTKIVSAGSREAELNNADAFIEYVKQMKF